ncbi:MAG: hypothetical protein ACJ76J_06195 [Thermoanaerobaculia bacterium]
MALRRFFDTPAGSLLHYWVRVEPPGCAALSLDVTVNGVRNPPQVDFDGGQAAPPLRTNQLANRSPEPFFGPVGAGDTLRLHLTVAFQAAGTVAVVPTLEEPGGGVQTRTPMVFEGQPGQLASADVSVLT